jgi:hypothetical protein
VPVACTIRALDFSGDIPDLNAIRVRMPWPAAGMRGL